MIRSILIGSLTLGVILTVGPHAYANDDAAACVRIEDAAARLACYDRAFGRISVEAQPDRTQQGEDAAGETSASALDQFGREHIASRRSTDSVDSIAARIEQLSQASNGLYTFSLDNGQIWRQTEASDAVRFRVGDEVAIKRGAFGSFRLYKQQGGRAVAVKRVR